MTEMTGFVRQMDMNGTCRIRQENNAASPLLYEGRFRKESLDALIRAMRDGLMVRFEIVGKSIHAELVEWPA